MATYKGFLENNKKMFADAAEIVRRLRETDITIGKLATEYSVGYASLKRAILTQITMRQYKSICRKKIANSGGEGRFVKGHATWNQGLHYIPGGRCAETQFTKGGIRGAAARNYRAIGTVSIRYDHPNSRPTGRGRPRKGKPRRFIKIADEGPPQDCWVPYAQYVYEKHYGPVPKGYFVVHRNRDRMDDAPCNLIITNKTGNMKRNTIQNLSDEKRSEIQKKAGKRRRKDSKARKLIKEHYGIKVVSWDCTGCGANYQQKEPPLQCSKCSHGGFEQIKIRKKTG